MKQKIPVWVAILININNVLGGAFFLGVQPVAAKSGALAPFVWLACGLMLMPLIFVFARLAKAFPMAGGLYVYSQKCLGNFWGFVSCWGYFIGTVAGNAAVIHAFSSYVKNIDYVKPVLAQYGMLNLSFDVLFVVLFAFFNILNLRFLETMQVGFTILKIIPIGVLLIGPFILSGGTSLSVATFDGIVGIFSTIPMVYFAYIGIEACCAVSDQIVSDDGKEKQTAKVIWVSFLLIVAMYVVLQGFVYYMQGSADIDPFLSVFPVLFANQQLAFIANQVVYLSILMSFLGSFYGMFFYNNWNLYALAQDKMIVGSSWLNKCNKNQIPYVCVGVQTFLLLILLLLSNHTHYLVTMSDFGVTIAYLLSTVAFLMMYRNMVGILSLLSCFAFIFISSITLFYSGLHNLIPLITMLLLGIVGFVIQQYKRNNSEA